MLSFEEFDKQDFFRVENHLEKYRHVKSVLISGKPSHKKISVVIPTYKRAHLLEEALESCFGQTYGDFSIVIADNNPERDDETELLIRRLDDPRIIYYKNGENMGPLANFNRCIELCDSDYCVFLCSDDLLDSEYLESVAGILGKTAAIDMLLPEKNMIYPARVFRMKGYSPLLRMLSGIFGKPAFVKLKPEDFLLYYPAGGPSGIAYRKASFLEAGGFNPLWHPTGDYILHFLMTMRTGGVYLTSVYSGEYRMLENITTLEKDMRSNYIIQNYMIRKAFAKASPTCFPVKSFFRGSAFHWLYMNLPGTTKALFNVPEIKRYIRHINFPNFLLYLAVWTAEYIRLIFRIRIRIR